jgi:hypothetical protein
MSIGRNPLKGKGKKQDIDDFLDGAEKLPKRKIVHPWDKADPEVIKVFNLRMPKPLKLKIEYITNRSPLSMHAFIMDAVEKAVSRELKKLVQE